MNCCVVDAVLFAKLVTRKLRFSYLLNVLFRQSRVWLFFTLRPSRTDTLLPFFRLLGRKIQVLRINTQLGVLAAVINVQITQIVLVVRMRQLVHDSVCRELLFLIVDCFERERVPAFGRCTLPYPATGVLVDDGLSPK